MRDPVFAIEELEHASPQVLRDMHRMLAEEIGRERRVMLMLGTLRADQRLAVFLIDLRGATTRAAIRRPSTCCG